MSGVVFRLFVSSPGDVATERARAESVVEKLNAEFKDRARFDPVFWEDHFYSAHATFQKQIPEAADCDLVVAIFKARLGSPLPEGFKRQADGEPYPSGTAYEVLSAIARRYDGAPLPDIYVFRYPRDPQVSLDDPKRGEIEAQWRALKGFFERWFKTAGGQFGAGFQSYNSSDDFADEVEACLLQWLAKRGIVSREMWDRARFGSPFPGLAAFEADRERVFFGRDLAIQQAIERLREAKTPFLLILGASGSGKSSLLRAGLMPKLSRPGAIPAVDLFRPVVITPGPDPFAVLAEALLAPGALGGELAGGRFADKASLTEALRGDPRTAAGLIGEALDKAAEARRAAAHFDKPRPARLLLAVDQAERLFAEAPKDADAFGMLLRALVGSVASVNMVMRADAYARLQACRPLLALRAVGATLDLMPPTVAELEDIVARPVAACEPKLAFGDSDPPLPRRLIADAKGGDALPLLQMTLENLYKAEKARGDGALRAEDYKGMAEAVTAAANAAMAPLGEGGRKALEALVAGLVADVALDPVTAEPAPVIVALDRDRFVKGRPERAPLIDAFVEARLLTLEGGGRVRPTHDALLRIWPEAAKLVKEMGALIRARHALLPLARAWTEAGPGEKSRHLQVSAPLLAAGQQLEARFGEDLGAPLRPFIAESLKAEAAQRVRETRRQRLILGATLSALAVMTALAGATAWQWREAAAQRAAAERNLALAKDAANSLVFHSDYASFASGPSSGELWRVDKQTGQRRRIGAAADLSWPAPSPDGSFIYALRGRQAVRVAVSDGMETPIGAPADWRKLLSVMPDGGVLGLIDDDPFPRAALLRQDGKRSDLPPPATDVERRQIGVLLQEARGYADGARLEVRDSERGGRGRDVFLVEGLHERNLSDCGDDLCGQPARSIDGMTFFYIRGVRL